MKRKTFLQIFILSIVCIAIIFVYGILAVQANSTNIIRERLEEETKLACSIIKDKDDVEGLKTYANDKSFRITVIGLDGTVLVDTGKDSELENHLDREEVEYAIKGKPQCVERYSETFRCKMTYYALKTEIQDGANTVEVVLRMAVKNSTISNYLIAILPVLFVVLCLALGFSIVFSELISKNVTAKITDVGKSLKTLNDGNYTPIRTDTKEPELYSVLSEINELNENTLKHIETEKEERDKLDVVLENILQGIIAIDKDKKILFANESVKKTFGFSGRAEAEELVFVIDDLKLCDEITKRSDDDCSFEYSYKGKELSVVIKKVESADEKDNVCSIIIFTDVTKEREIAKQKSDFFANASHELKTPVAVMQGLSELLLTKKLDEGSKKQIERIHGESVRLSSLIADMLNLSMLESGVSSETVAAEIDLKKVAEEVLNELAPKIAEKGVTATVTGDGKITGDGKKIYELVENLCSNAVNYNNEKGKINVEITKDDSAVTLKVADTGIGIDKENLPRLCERFYRVDKSRSKKTGGTGLGLAIVKHICALHNATLKIDSDLGLGTTVTVTFNK